jgi:hypothetical protein
LIAGLANSHSGFCCVRLEVMAMLSIQKFTTSTDSVSCIQPPSACACSRHILIVSARADMVTVAGALSAADLVYATDFIQARSILMTQHFDEVVVVDSVGNVQQSSTVAAVLQRLAGDSPAGLFNTDILIGRASRGRARKSVPSARFV